MLDLSDLTAEQAAAVTHVDGPMLVLAGPGSGKTRVVTRRIAHLIRQGIPARQILAITFTNKAATEMANRVEQLLPGSRVWVSTFHRLCSWLLRQYGSSIGLQRNFTILDTSAQKSAIKRVLSDLDYDTVHYSPPKVLYRIGEAKNNLITPEQFQQTYDEKVADHFEAVVAKVYPAYQKWLLESNAVDFDDLLYHVAQLLIDTPELRQMLDERFRYILVDEYQDTNHAQYQLIKMLSQNFQNLSVTGDPDQSIYGWRGARIKNILDFEQDYPEAKTVKLEQNFRSTKAILESANNLIQNNQYRKAKVLKTDAEEGEPVELIRFEDSQTEADAIAQIIRQRVEEGERSYDDFAIFYRVNALSRELEIAMRRHGVPAQIASGVGFYDRAEVMDLLAYLHLIFNPADRSAFQRVINKPLRGIGKTSQQRLMSWAEHNGKTYLEAAQTADQVPKLAKRAISGMKAFARMIGELSLADSGSVSQLLRDIISKTGYARAFEDSQYEEDLQRLANVNELIAAAQLYDDVQGEEGTLEGFLETTSLVSDLDQLEENKGAVTLMTLHSAKGLEYPVVFIVGVEQNMIPHERSMRSKDLREFEEERRLLFVGMTRAEEELYLTESQVRSIHGRPQYSIESEFLSEIDLVQSDGAVMLDAILNGDDEQADEGEKSWRIDKKQSADDGFSYNEEMPQEPLTFGERQAQRSAAKKGKPNLGFAAQTKLMTGSDLLSGGGTAAELPFSFPLGSAVRHPRYGVGTVTEVGGFGARRTVTVEFEDEDRQETFIMQKCPLQPVSRKA